jgi:hypothetical protein
VTVLASKDIAISDATDDDEPRRQFTIRMDFSDWRRVKQVALDLDVSVQQLVVAALSRVLVERGMAPIGPDPDDIIPTPKKRKPKGGA